MSELQKNCAICQKEAEQQHHLSYNPEIVISVCKTCHLLLHATHGVGSAKGSKLYDPTKTKYLIELASAQAQGFSQVITNFLNLQPIYTHRIRIDETRTAVVRAKSHTVLNQLSCGCKGNTWQLFVDPDDNMLFLRCPDCGCDFQIIEFKTQRKKPNDE